MLQVIIVYTHTLAYFDIYKVLKIKCIIASCFIYSKYRIFSLPSLKRQQNIYHDKCKRYTNEPYMNSSTLEQIHINKGQPNAHRRLSPTHKSYHRKRSLITNHSQPCAFGHSIRYAEAKTIYGLVNSGSDYYFFFLVIFILSFLVMKWCNKVSIYFTKRLSIDLFFRIMRGIMY